jgi:hypothetical protein
VIEAATVDEALRVLEHQHIDIVAASLDLPPGGSGALLAAMRHRPEWAAIPVLALAESSGQVREHAGHRHALGSGPQQASNRAANHTADQSLEFQDCQVKFDREAMLESIARLASAVAGSEAGSQSAHAAPHDFVPARA